MYCIDNSFQAVKISGTDAHIFLERLLTSKVRELKNTGDTQLSCLLNPKGGLISFFFLECLDSGDLPAFLMHLPRALQEASVNELKKYILRKKVDIAPLVDSQPTYFWRYRDSGTAPAEMNSWRDLYQSQDQKFSLGYILEGPNPDSRMKPELCQALRIKYRIPEVTSEILPGMLPLESDFLRGAIGQNKGCYPGQETTARLISRGENTAYKLIGLEADQPIASTALIMGPEGTQLGQLTSVSPMAWENKYYALARVHRNFFQTETKTLQTQGHPDGHIKHDTQPFHFRIVNP